MLCGRFAGCSRAGEHEFAPVYVSNTTSQCVPVSVYHSIALPVTQSGNWSVTAKNTTSTPIFTKDLRIPGVYFTPTDMTIHDTKTFSGAQYFLGYNDLFIIKSVQGWSNSGTAGSEATEYFVQVDYNGTLQSYWAGQFTPVPSDPHTAILSNTNAYIPVPAGASVTVTAERTATSGTSSVNVTLSGDLEPTPAY